MSQSQRPTYTEDQISRWLKLIGVDTRIAKDQCDTEAGLEYLNRLLPRQMYTVPFENLNLHYAPHKEMLIDAQHMYEFIVDKGAGRGGYCMQNNLFFGTMLRSLGYKVLPVGARVSSAATGVDDPAQVQYTGWSHTVNIVYIEGKKYFCDVGFGSNCPSRAIPLENGWTGRSSWTDFDNMHLTFDHTLDNTVRTEQQKVWIYHVRFGEERPWLPMFCFTELEFLPQDFEVMNFRVSRSFASFFTFRIMLRKCILDENGDDIGDLTMFDTVIKQRKHGKSVVLAEVRSEQERVEALKKFFNVKLNAKEVAAINGYVSMIH